jgi:hypothetical protein
MPKPQNNNRKIKRNRHFILSAANNRTKLLNWTHKSEEQQKLKTQRRLLHGTVQRLNVAKKRLRKINSIFPAAMPPINRKKHVTGCGRKTIKNVRKLTLYSWLHNKSYYKQELSNHKS